MKPVGGAVLVLHPLTQAGSRGTDVLARPLAGEDPLIQTAGGQNVFLIDPTERQTVGRAPEIRGDKEKQRWWSLLKLVAECSTGETSNRGYKLTLLMLIFNFYLLSVIFI